VHQSTAPALLVNKTNLGGCGGGIHQQYIVNLPLKISGETIAEI
jgi:hypothetical protein